jgi:hypothetical protein
VNGAGKPIVALDIDGTLGDYHGHFLGFAGGWFNQKFPDPEEINPGIPLWEFMGVEHHKYAECKLAYRQGGMKRTMPVYIGAAFLTQYLRRQGCEVWICTTRPYMRLDNIDPDTKEWLARNHIEYDAVLFDTLEGKGTKYDELARQAGDRVAAILEDLPELCLRAASLVDLQGNPVLPQPIIRTQPYNRHFDWPKRTDDLVQALAMIAKETDKWKASNR